MEKKNGKGTKSKIVSAAWKLFYDNGYENTTIDDIVWESGTSKGSFYHYFESKDALLGSLAYLFDEKYEELSDSINYSANAIDTLLSLNKTLFEMVENTVDLDLLARLYSTQLTAKSGKQLLDHDRTYYRLLKKVISEGQRGGSITNKISVNEAVRYYAFCERSILYDWCLFSGDYSLKDYSAKMMDFLMNYLRN